MMPGLVRPIKSMWRTATMPKSYPQSNPKCEQCGRPLTGPIFGIGLCSELCRDRWYYKFLRSHGHYRRAQKIASRYTTTYE